jgi:hypothetical protein
MCNENNISENITEAFSTTEYSIWMVDFHDIYLKIVELLPPRNSPFSDLSLEYTIGCEVVCAAICHQINWDFLRKAVFEMTTADKKWISLNSLSKITIADVNHLLHEYDKPERIRGKERSLMLRSLGESLESSGYNTYCDIFFSENYQVREPNKIISVINSSKAFSSDPEEKKTQLLLQNLSDYTELSELASFCKPAIDYHIIREFLRRGLVLPETQIGNDFIFNPDVQRKEQTVAALRKLCADIFHLLAWLTGCDIKTLNSIEWWMGRSVCLKEHPDCELMSNSAQWLKPIFQKCPFFDSCHAIQVDRRFLNIIEPNYRGSSY